MGIFLEVLEWFDETGEEMAHRLPPEGSADIKFGAQLVVRESQEAIFFSSGEPRDHFGPGRHTLSSKNLPILTQALSLPWGFTSPFRCEVYFLNRKTFTNLRWGTREPVIFQDSRLGSVRLRAYGTTTFRIEDAGTFLRRLVGQRGSFSTLDATEYLRDVIIARLNDYLGENLQTVFDLPALYDETGEELKAKLSPDFAKYGLALEDFFITAITPPDEVAQMVDAQGGLSLVDDMPRYMQYQLARALHRGPGSGEGKGSSTLDAGMGLGLGILAPGLLSRGMAGELDSTRVECGACGAKVACSRFCSACGRPLARPATEARDCPACGEELPRDARFCPACGGAVSDPEDQPSEEN